MRHSTLAAGKALFGLIIDGAINGRSRNKFWPRRVLMNIGTRSGAPKGWSMEGV